MAVEILSGKRSSLTAAAILGAMQGAIKASGEMVVETRSYRGGCEWLLLFGVGAAAHAKARDVQIARGGKALLLDIGYFGREKVTGYCRVSVNHDHPQQWLDRTEPDPSRWDAFRMPLRDDHSPSGPIILVGMGRKSRAAYGEGWARRKHAELVSRFPGRRIIHRPKPGSEFECLPCKHDIDSPIGTLLKGASLVVTRHSNVAVDAVIAGVPSESEDGAAMWLAGKEFTHDIRLDFLRRLAWWQWKSTEAREAWKFIKEVVA